MSAPNANPAEGDLEKNSKLIIERGERLYALINEFCKKTEDIAAETPLLSYAYSGLKMIEDTYKTLVDISIGRNMEPDVSTLKNNLELMLNEIWRYYQQRNAIPDMQ
jgi:hypothetical protein